VRKIIMGELILMNLCRSALGVQFFLRHSVVILAVYMLYVKHFLFDLFSVIVLAVDCYSVGTLHICFTDKVFLVSVHFVMLPSLLVTLHNIMTKMLVKFVLLTF